jgi:methanogenic corrinoid protein MtbC1
MSASKRSAEASLQEVLSAVRSLDASALEAALGRAELAYGHQGLLRRVIQPLLESIGELWKVGEITAAHEHFASAFVRGFLTRWGKPFAASTGAPRLVVATPAGQLHEMGAALVAAAASGEGWQVTYLGVSLPAAEIAGAALQNQARAVALSLVYPENDPSLVEELQRLRRYLPTAIAIITGGRAASSYLPTLAQIGAWQCADLDEFSLQLARARGADGTAGITRGG